MFPLLFSVLSGVRELSATASLADFQPPEASPGLPSILGVSSKDLLASVCPIAVALIVATIRHYNEKQMQQRTSDSDGCSNLLSTFEDADVASYGKCGDIGAALQRRRSKTFYVSDNSIMIFRVRTLSLNSMPWARVF